MTGPALLRRPAPTTVTPVAGRRGQAAEPAESQPAGPMVTPDEPMAASTPGRHVQATEPAESQPAGPMAAPAPGRHVQATEPAESQPAGPTVTPDEPMVTPGDCLSRWTGGWVA